MGPSGPHVNIAKRWKIFKRHPEKTSTFNERKEKACNENPWGSLNETSATGWKHLKKGIRGRGAKRKKNEN